MTVRETAGNGARVFRISMFYLLKGNRERTRMSLDFNASLRGVILQPYQRASNAGAHYVEIIQKIVRGEQARRNWYYQVGLVKLLLRLLKQLLKLIDAWQRGKYFPS